MTRFQDNSSFRLLFMFVIIIPFANWFPMKRHYLILEQLEDRIFLDANPVVVADDVSVEAEQVAVLPVSSETEGQAPESGSEDAGEEQVPGESTTTGSDDVQQDNVSVEDDGSGEQQESETEQESEQSLENKADNPKDVGVEQDSTVTSDDTQQEADSAENVEGEEQLEDDPGQKDEQSQNTAEGSESALAPTDEESDGVAEAGEVSDDVDQKSELQQPTSGETDETEAAIELIDPMIGEDFTFSYSFENTLAQTGYGPYVDIYFPTSGVDNDGDHPDPQPPGSDVYDGIKYVSATYLGTPVTAVEQTFDASGKLEHAFAKDSNGNPLIVNGDEGDTYVSLQLPFGSYTPQQPAAEIEITAHMSNLAEVDRPLNVTSSSGFMFGSDPLDNPSTDPSLPNQNAQTTAWLPEVIRFEKDYVGPENETATGPNYPRSYSITVDVANGQTVGNLQIRDTLPANIVFSSAEVPANVRGASVTGSSFDDVSNVLTIDLANNPDGSFTGGTGIDTNVSFDYYVGDILPGCSTTTGVVNDMQLEADWTPLDDRDPSVHLVIDAEVYPDGSISTTPDVDEVFEAQPITIQKSAVNITDGVNSPSDIIQYTLEFQISDYHALGNIEIQDLMSNGMTFFSDATHDPHFTIQDQNGNYVNDFTVGTDLDLTPRPDLNNETQIDFHVSAALITAGDGDGILEGGRTNGSSGIAATGTITYYGQINEFYASSTIPVDQGDTLANNVQVSVDRYDYDAAGHLIPTACHMANADGSTAEVQMPVGGVDKTLYAVNGVVLAGCNTKK